MGLFCITKTSDFDTWILTKRNIESSGIPERKVLRAVRELKRNLKVPQNTVTERTKI